MADDYRGLYLIGDKKTGRITDVQVVDDGGVSITLPFAVYVARGRFKTLTQPGEFL